MRCPSWCTSYGYWNLDHLELIAAAKDANSGCVALLDELTGAVGAAIQLWQLSTDQPSVPSHFRGGRYFRIPVREGRIPGGTTQARL